jgi:hypothetical protein
MATRARLTRQAIEANIHGRPDAPNIIDGAVLTWLIGGRPALLVLDVPVRTVMSLMGWSSADMAARYQHVTDAIRQDVARQVDVLIWQASGAAVDDGTIPVSRDSLTAILRLAELGLVHADEAVMADPREAIEQIRTVLADRTGQPGPGTALNPTRGTK